MRSSTKNALVKILKFSFAAGLIFWMVQKGLLDLSVLGQLLTPLHIAVSLLLIFINICINNWRWSLLLRSQDLPGNFLLTLPLSLVGLFFNFAVPGAVGGDLVKAYYVAQDHPGRKMAAATTVMMDRIVGLYSMIWLAEITMLLNLGLVWERRILRHIFISSSVLAVLMTLILALMFSPTVKAKNPLIRWAEKLPGGDFLNRFYDAIHAYGKNLKSVMFTVIVSLVSQIVAVSFMAYVGMVAIGESLPMATYFFAVPLGFIVMAVPLSPAGIGVGQVAFLVLFRLFAGDETTVGQTAITAYQIGLLCWSLVGAVIYAQRKRPNLLNEVSTT